jgi:hypothetical protein
MNENYYNIMLSYEIPYNVLDSQEPDIIKARDTLYGNLKDCLPEKYDRFSVKLVLHQVKDTYNYLLTFSAFFRSKGNLPMSEYVEARDLKDSIKKEIEEFFNSVDCDYRQINIKALL